MFINKYGELRSGWVLAMATAVIFAVQIGLTFPVIIIAVILAGSPDNFEEYAAELMGSPLVHIIMCIVSTALLFLLFWIVYKRPLSHMGFYKNGCRLPLCKMLRLIFLQSHSFSTS